MRSAIIFGALSAYVIIQNKEKVPSIYTENSNNNNNKSCKLLFKSGAISWAIGVAAELNSLIVSSCFWCAGGAGGGGAPGSGPAAG